MDLGTAPLFDLTAAAAQAVVELAVEAPITRTRSQELLAGIRDNRAVLTSAQIAEVRMIAEWAAEHVVDDEADASTLTERGWDTGLPVAGPGAPLISDFAVMELSALLGRSQDSGRNYVGQVVELAYRLPKNWVRVLAGAVPVWKALRIADHTRLLPLDAASFVDAQLAPYAAGCSWAQIDRLVETALIRFDPEAAEEKRRSAAETRGVDLGITDADPATGIAYGTTALDLPDALDLEQAIARRAKLLGELGDDDSLDVRRAKALGELAREDLMLDLPVPDPDTGEIKRNVPGRKSELVIHIDATDHTVARFANTRTPITAEQVKAWFSLTNTSVLVRPVIDLNGHQPVDSYEIPNRIRRQVTLRDHHCAYPYCTNPAERCDLDHVVSYAEGGPTSAANLAPASRGHHRMKTAGRAQVRVLHPGTLLWTLPSGTYLVDPTGTYDLTPTPNSADPPEA
jgi:hypothetical protein